ncbi:MAG TPA: serine--tRNA ligase [Fimbriimonadaceae bacterium]|mgnify:CR=1 FL=1|nr:serine--tRNA ligase [Fimbriimonadaceae bacterium]
MIDRQLLRNNLDQVRAGVAKKHMSAPLDEWATVYAEFNAFKQELEAHQAESNRVSKTIGQLMGQGKKEEAEAAKIEAKRLSDLVAAGEPRARELETRLTDLELSIPNVPHESVPEGKTAEENVVIRTWGEKPTGEFKPHWDVAEDLKMIDLERGSKISGSGFVVYTGWGARLQRALINFMVDHQTTKNGYYEIYPPYVVNTASLIGTGQLPKFEEDLYKVDEDGYLIPTAEVPVTNLYRDEILSADQLTVKMAAFSGCFRKEAGAAGKDTRGIQRVHQFDKVELVKMCLPENSYDELESLVADAESVLQALGMHYRVVLLCGGDMSFSNAKCYDLEIWAPGVEKYLEISSCSNFESFQARRANIRFRREQGGKPEFCHILNGSGLATPRLFASILEACLQPDGSLLLPEPLRPYIGTDRIVKG